MITDKESEQCVKALSTANAVGEEVSKMSVTFQK